VETYGKLRFEGKRVPRKSKSKPVSGTAAELDALLLAPVKIVKNGTSVAVPLVEKIIYRLLQHALKGNAKAERTLMKYREFASRFGTRKLEIVFIENEYTKSLSASPSEDDDV
jgi:hypothetical protein